MFPPPPARVIKTEGLEEENRDLRDSGYSSKLTALQTIGYLEFDQYFEENQTIEETFELVITRTRQYAKRQKSWFRRNKEAIWIKDFEEAEKLVDKFLTKEG